MEEPANATLRPPAAPRHLRRRRLREDIPDTLLVPDAAPFVPAAPQAAAAAMSPQPTEEPPAADLSPSAAEEPPPGNENTADAVHFRPPERTTTPYRRKRRVAMTILILVSVSIPVLILALILSA